ncbi:hypothetical protein FACS1894181_02560 [Bacteroidia bacterium]|nr:hypothetical protein FACS1894181_02560 [Bacteroidia bacterium]
MVDYQIVGKTSIELTEKEWQELSCSFNSIFDKEFSVEYFKDKYLHSYLNFSIHGFLLYQEQIVGMFSIIPRLYNFSGEHKIIGLGCDAFILPNHRKDEFFLKEMADAAYGICENTTLII